MHSLMDSVFPSFLGQKKPGSHSLKSAERCLLGHWSRHSKSNWFIAMKPLQCMAMLSPLQPLVFMLLTLTAFSLTACVFKECIALRFFYWFYLNRSHCFIEWLLQSPEWQNLRRNAYGHRFATFIHFTAATAFSVCVHCNFVSSPPHPFFRSPLAEHLLSLLTLPNCLDRLEVEMVLVSWHCVPSVVSWS